LFEGVLVKFVKWKRAIEKGFLKKKEDDDDAK